jgi:hypothetical protein
MVINENTKKMLAFFFVFEWPVSADTASEAPYVRSDATLLSIAEINLFANEGSPAGLFIYLFFASTIVPTLRYFTHHEHLSC